MGYLHIENLYKNQDILLFKECYALEKIHGTSAHVKWIGRSVACGIAAGCTEPPDRLIFFSGGEKHARFITLFDHEKLEQKFQELFPDQDVIVYGEAYGGSQQKQ